MNIAFFGTSDRSIPILCELNSSFSLKLCVTKADTLIGRKQEVRETAVKQWAKKMNIDFYCITSLKEETSKIMDQLRAQNIDLAIVADFSFILPEEIINTPPQGMLNIHFSLLPRLRGASPVQHTILNGDTSTGVTFYKMDKGMDTGKIVQQIPYNLIGKENSEELYSTLFNLAAQNITNTITNYINGSLIPVEQDEALATYCRSKTNPKVTFILKEDAQIDWSNSTQYIDRQIRAFYPWPVAWTFLKDLENNDKLLAKFSYKPNINKDLKIKIIRATLQDSKLDISQLQIEGKNIVDWKSFSNGYFLN